MRRNNLCLRRAAGRLLATETAAIFTVTNAIEIREVCHVGRSLNRVSSSRSRLKTGEFGSTCSAERLTRCPIRNENRRPAGLSCNESIASNTGNSQAKRQLQSAVYPKTTFG